MRIETISYIKQHAANLDVSEPIVVTQNGMSAYIIESYEDKKKRDNAIALLKLISLSEQDLQHGKIYAKDELLDTLKSEYNV